MQMQTQIKDVLLDGHPRKFITTLNQSNPKMLRQVAGVLEHYAMNRLDAEGAYAQLVELFKDDVTALAMFNEGLIKDRQVAYLGKQNVEKMVTYLLTNVAQKGVNQKQMNEFVKISIEVCKNYLDKRAYFSYDDLIDYYMIKMIEFESQHSLLGNEFHAIIDEVLNDFRKSLNEPEPSRPRPVPIKKGKVKPETEPPKPVVEPKIPTPIKYEEQILDHLEECLSPEDIQALLKIFWLYYKSVISYSELIELAQNILIKLRKESCAVLKTALESREWARISRSPFNLKFQMKDKVGDDANKSYKILEAKELKYDITDDVLNKSYVCVAHGTESTGTYEEGSGKRFIKNNAEELLLKIEDEMHEFDYTIQQLDVFTRYLIKMEDPTLEPKRFDTYLMKINNLKLIHHIYGSRAPQIIRLFEECNKEIVMTIRKRLQEHLLALQKTRENLREGWHQKMKANFYKGLDILSNSIKMMEKKIFVNKQMLEELKTNKKIRGKVKLWSSIGKLLAVEQDEYIDYAKGGNVFSNPSLAFSLAEPTVLADTVALLHLLLQTSKNSGADKQRSRKLIKKLILIFFEISEPNLETFIGEIDTEASLKEKLADVERRIPDRAIIYSDRFQLKMDIHKIPDLLENLKGDKEDNKKAAQEPKNAEQNQPENEFEQLIESNNSVEDNYPEMRAKEEGKRTQSRMYFGSHQFYVFYRYILYAMERLQYVYEYSAKTLGTSEIYCLFKKLVIYNIHGVIDNSSYEEAIRTLMGNHGGILLNLDKIVANALKIHPNDDFSNYVLKLHKRLFSSEASQPLSEDVIFAKSCFKLNEVTSVNNKSYRNSAMNSFNTNYNVVNNELLKFEFIKSKRLFVVHKIKSIFQDDGKVVYNTYKALMEKNYNYVSRVCAMEEYRPEDFHIVNNIPLHLNAKKKEFVFSKAGAEDVVMRIHDEASDNKKRKNIKAKKMKDFKLIRDRLFRSQL